eukprot:1466880-Amphidinium_carterae.1
MSGTVTVTFMNSTPPKLMSVIMSASAVSWVIVNGFGFCPNPRGATAQLQMLRSPKPIKTPNN